jgi:hypothetical protein
MRAIDEELLSVAVRTRGDLSEGPLDEIAILTPAKSAEVEG